MSSDSMFFILSSHLHSKVQLVLIESIVTESVYSLMVSLF